MNELILENQKFKEDLVDLINKTKLPAFIIEYILKELLEQVNIQKQLQYNKAIENKDKPESEGDK